MTLPLIVLAAGSILIGFLGVPNFIVEGGNRFGGWLAPVLGAGHAEGGHEVHHASAALEWGLMLLSLAVAVGGILVGLLFYQRRPELPQRAAATVPGLYRLIANKYYVDETYRAAVILPIRNGSRALLWKIVDVRVIDFLVNLVGISSRFGSYVVRLAQTGYVQFYAAVIVIGLAIILWVVL
jgi:NADH-quinone oxidoreductase subunit L